MIGLHHVVFVDKFWMNVFVTLVVKIFWDSLFLYLWKAVNFMLLV